MRELEEQMEPIECKKYLIGFMLYDMKKTSDELVSDKAPDWRNYGLEWGVYTNWKLRHASAKDCAEAMVVSGFVKIGRKEEL